MSSRSAQFHVSHSRHEVVVHAIGEVDLATSVDFEACVLEVVDSDRDLVFDMSEVTFMDSSGLRVMSETAQRRGAAGRLVVRDASANVRRILDISGLSDVYRSDSSDRSEV